MKMERLHHLIVNLNSEVTLSNQALKNADINVDGKVNKTDSRIILKYESGDYRSIPVTTYIEYGDLNEDGEIDLSDTIMITKYIGGKIEISDQAKKNADVNVDGIINSTDQLILSKYVVGQYTTLPVTD